jgi:ABC-2 type transport system permease protein
MTVQSPAAAASPEGSIYDLGYRHYEGKRHGGWFAVWSLFTEGLRSVWGLGRPMTAKGWPFALAGIYAFPALLQLALSSVFAQAMSEGNKITLFAYGDYFGMMWILIMLFCMAQGPELVCRDQRSQVLSLYFTRPLGHAGYAFARAAALSTALFITLMVPMIALFIGDVLMKPDTLSAIGDELPKALPALPANALIAVGMATISLGLAAFSPRRAYSTIGLVAYFLLMEGVPEFVYSAGQHAGWTWADKTFLLSPVTTLIASSSWFFGAQLSGDYPITMSADQFVAAAFASVAVFSGLLLLRYRSISA